MRMKTIRLLSILTVCVMLLGASPALAQTPTPSVPFDEVQLVSTAPTFRSGTSARVEKGETIPGDMYIAGENVEIAGEVMGDVYVAGGRVDITGSVAGSVYVVAGQFDIQGNVAESVIAIGGAHFVAGTIGKNMGLVGGTVVTTPELKLAGNASVVGGNVRLDTPFGQHVTVAAGTFSLVKPIQGSLSYVLGDEKAVAVDEDLVAGEVRRFEIPRMAKEQMVVTQKQQDTFFSFMGVLHVLSLMLSGLLFVYAMPHLVRDSAQVVRSQTWKSIGVGFVALIALPVAGLVMALTLVAFPLALMLFALYATLMYLSSFVTMYALGTMIMKKFQRSWTDASIMAVGLVAVLLIQIVPLTGFFVQLMGLGGLLLASQALFVSLREGKKL